MTLQPLGRGFIAAGLILIIIGVLLIVAGKIPGIGRLPGDIYIHKENFSFYFPLTTCLILSLILTLLFYWFGKK